MGVEINMTDRQIEKEYDKKFWKNYNKKCLRCIESCKQSDQVTVWMCRSYKKEKK